MLSCSPVAIVDDDDIFQMLIKSILEKSINEPILQFLSGFETLSYFKKNANNISALPIVLFLDLTMPGMTGWEFLDEYRKLRFPNNYHLSIFILSGSSNIDFEKLRMYPVIHGYLTKPVATDRFINIVQQIINKELIRSDT